MGYIPVDEDEIGNGLFTRSISRTIEYSYNDFCIAQIARDMGKKSDAEKYLERSKNWINVLKKDASSEVNGEDSGFQAFAMPKFQDGSWDYQDPTICSQINDFDGCYLNEDGKETYEGSSWLYTFYVPHDAATLIQELGGDETFVERLRFFHDTPGLFYVGNEPSYLMIFLFHYVGRPGLSAEYAHRYIPSSFNDTVSGLPGNDDSGAMGSFAALTMMGFYPMSGQDIYLIIPPFFREVNIKSPLSGKTATITTINFDAGYKNIYIQSAKLNGKTYNKSWLTHEFFNEGGELELTLGHEESEWGQGKDNIPPSASTRFW